MDRRGIAMKGCQILSCDGPNDQLFLRTSPQGDAAVRIGSDADFIFASVRLSELDLGIIRYLVCVDGAWDRIMNHEYIRDEFKKKREAGENGGACKHISEVA